MSAIGTLNPGSGGLLSSLDTSKLAPVSDADISAQNADTPTKVEGIKVSLSGAGIEKSAEAKGENSDIEESGLPDNIQQILKMIRKLQQQVAEKLAEMQAVMKDKRLSPEERKAKLGALQAFINNLNGGLIVANTALSKAMKQAGLTPEQILKAASLAMKS
ncbi:hypothetical protein [Pseudomonas frederiksbergensis]|uniref:Uncharacterized protein n=1 Tax=Pseudomonas frederiksbergensis TaxID=104087 RepID=A0A423KQC1_9PSED|nr:hypothetical protein [Pseudomonas frederiksbergensis]RON57341.1 hypothetical protein BK665_04345 [Pseudomonas frederiksbergensis]